MGRQSITEVLFLTLNHNMTIMGKVWLLLMVLLRVLVLLMAGYPLYQDEQERFVCNTIQPGCTNVCFDVFSPISLFRFWLVQLLLLCLPYLLFVVHVVHKVSSGLTVESHTAGRVKASPQYKARQEPCGKASTSRAAHRTEQGASHCFIGAYIVHLFMRILLEACFGAAHYYLFGFHIPKQFLCHRAPCTTTVDCYISRPTEKTVMLNFMLGVSALSFLLNFADLICAVKWSVKQQRSRGKTVVQKVYEEEQYYLSPSGRGPRPEIPLARDLVASAAFRKRTASKSSSDDAASVHLEGADLKTPPCDGLLPPPPPLLPGSGPNTNGDSVFKQDLEEGLERDGSDAPLCPTDAKGTPRSIRVCKHSRLKPPPPPRREKAPTPPSAPPTPEFCGRRVGQYTLVEMATELQSNSSDTQEKRSEWV